MFECIDRRYCFGCVGIRLKATMTMRLLDLFITSSIPVAKILLITGIGFYLALDQVNILNQDARKQLNNVSFFRHITIHRFWLIYCSLMSFVLFLQIVFYVFSPSLVASSLSETITYESMVKMLVFFLIFREVILL